MLVNVLLWMFFFHCMPFWPSILSSWPAAWQSVAHLTACEPICHTGLSLVISHPDNTASCQLTRNNSLFNVCQSWEFNSDGQFPGSLVSYVHCNTKVSTHETNKDHVLTWISSLVSTAELLVILSGLFQQLSLLSVL